LARVTGHPTWRTEQREGGGEELIVDRTNRLLRANGQAYLKLAGQGVSGAGFFPLPNPTATKAPVATNQVVEIRSADYEQGSQPASWGRGPKSKVQSPRSKVRSPESRVQSLTPKVQGPRARGRRAEAGGQEQTRLLGRISSRRFSRRSIVSSERQWCSWAKCA